jgi:D-glycero-D-manno-heptose 1,7-bisphosphate phosphatase
MARAVFLDRDGVINEAFIRDGRPYPPRNLSEVKILQGVDSALTELRLTGWRTIVITNQPDVGRGSASRSDVESINAYLMSRLDIDDFRVCYHDDADKCQCRKPLPGAILSAALEHGIVTKDSFMIGDRWRDIEAGYAAGCKTIFIDYKYKEKSPINPDYTVGCLVEAVKIINKHENY